MDDLKVKSFELRRHVLDMIMKARTGHIGGDFSVMDILVNLYFRQMDIGPGNMDDPDRDMFVLSKGHSVESYYAVLAAKGFFPIEKVMDEFSAFGSKFIGHPNNKLPGIEMNSGSLGHGLPVCIGMALASRMDGRKNRIYVVMGDGERRKVRSGKVSWQEDIINWITCARLLTGTGSRYQAAPRM